MDLEEVQLLDEIECVVGTIRMFQESWDLVAVNESNTFDVTKLDRYEIDRVAIPLGSISEFCSDLADWLNCGKMFEISIPNISERELMFKLCVDPDVISSVEKPVFVLKTSSFGSSLTFRFVTDQSCVRLLAADLRSIAGSA